MAEFYTAFKAFHIISIITWMAALFYLPRLFVYHAQQYENADFTRVAAVQEKKLYYYIGYPAMICSLLSGVLLIASNPYIFKSGGWLHAKLLFVGFLFIFHFACGFYRKRLLLSCYKSEKFFRIFNEIPTLLMIAIVIFAVCKPF
ncbi:protoporphyrinogen oxidase HemJ [Helicobacter saguini]|uniref:Protoporphyrinogen IX oxidase n=1 Tax=Helicobacter saguini TaxID=1548018 RepID=A0A347VQL3_9HELI|nr:protoporphyrinogen oxidase HemJ [Helicobacter saguini]MWV60904.1 protoporphyrinogen oxidase HemJ [Helicobacter saguini]MWV68428.1 protoporphyrinogen oxidase HemJ [Helicobacter saguini]MWV70108.1 protoporphyrinogen oxidase HemJ [Helicobacter saguini]MWV72011.1 protoporphyrinogen oxidase HemJ [Helicobacter saguini]TLD93765.1 protoporphyrinogen oxidase HemJ [Helicobacter saguini]